MFSKLRRKKTCNLLITLFVTVVLILGSHYPGKRNVLELGQVAEVIVN